MVDRAETEPHGNGLTQQTNGLDGDVAAGSDHTFEALAPTQSIAALTQRLNRLTQELAESGDWAKRQEAALEKTTRRLQQLIGERNSLATLLSERNAELQRLNRELGALSARVESAQVRSPALFAATRKLLDGLRNARNASRRAKPAAPRAHQADPRVDGTRLVPWVKHRPPKDVFAVVVFGLSKTEIQCVLDVVERHCAEHEAAPLLLTDNDSFELFRNRRVLFEFFPPRSEQQRVAPDLDWQLFTLRRLALIRRKWRPVRVVPFGRRAAEVVQLWRDSPFEETPLPSLSHNQPLLASGPAQPSVAA